MQKEIKRTKKLKFDNSHYNILNDIHFNQINFRVGGRGLGKTFSALAWLINDFLNENKIFTVIRRRVTDCESIFGKIVNYFDIKMTHEYDEKSCIDYVYVNGQKAGHIISLSCATKYNSCALDSQNILFDEFIKRDTDKRISEDECFTFFDVLECINRDNTDLTVVLLSNAVKINNDYFRFFNISLSMLEIDKLCRVNHVVNILMLKSTEEYLKLKSQTLVYQASKNTKFFDYAYLNNFDTGNLKYYVKNNNSKLLPCKNDFYFNIDDITYCVNDKYINIIDISDVPKKAVVYSDNLIFCRNSVVLQKIELITMLQNNLTKKLVYQYIYFSTIDIAIKLANYIFMQEF